MSARYLLIVESPAKAKTINKILGRDFTVKASMGHVRDLPEKKLGVRVEKDFEPEYVILRDRAKALKELKQAAAGVERIYLAPDPDREGEAIAWHLREAMRDVAPAEKFLRVTYNEITAPAVRRAIEHPGAIDMNRVNSQQARRVLDRLVGFKVSQLLWRRVRGASSAGRVQSAALRLVCEREEAIRRFHPVEYWILGARVALRHEPRTPFVVRLARIDGAKAEVGSAARAEEIRADLERRGLRVLGEQRREISRRAPPPFITSSLQQAASRALGMTPPRTMRSAQSLYEGMDLGDGPTGLITYMRTDSFSIAAEAQADARAFVAGTYGADYVPEKPNVYRSRSGAQQAHEAIRPTDVRRTPESLAGMLKPDEARLYRLIWQRFVASQMAPARIAQRTVEVEAEPPPAGVTGHDYLFRATASEVVFPGYQKVTGDDRPKKVAREESDEPAAEGDAEEADALPPVVAGEGLDRLDWLADQKFTEPPPRFSDATLIKAMEENGIGRPSTYAATVQVLHDRKYIEREKRALRPLPLGEKVYGFLTQHLDELFAIKFTARMEEELDEVEAGRVEWHAMLREFYGKFEPWLVAARAPVEADDPAAVRRLLDLMAGVREWSPPVTRGKRTYDDRKFVDSVREQLEAGEKVISQPQLDALRKLAARYAAQVPEIEAEARALGLPEPGADGGQTGEAITGRLSLFEGIEFDPPREVRGRTYDDAEFIASLRGQAEGGRGLSERQVAALDRVLHKYAAKIPDFEQRAKALGLDEGGAVVAADPAECRRAVETLAAVTEWKPPVQRGKRTWDDRAFYDSVRRQFEAKGALSPRQLASLKKMAARYAAAGAKRAAEAKD